MTWIAMLLCFLSGLSLSAGFTSQMLGISSPALHYITAAVSLALAVAFGAQA